MSKYSLKQIVDSVEQKKTWEKQYPMNHYIVRPLSFFVTYLIIRVTDSASSIAWIGFVIGLSGCLSFLGLSWWTAWPGILLLFTFSLLDAVDGNIARTTGNVTYFGRFLDSVLGQIIEATYCFWIGLGLALSESADFQLASTEIVTSRVPVLPILCGVLIMAGRLISSFIDLQYRYLSAEKQENRGRPQRSIGDQIQTSTFKDHLAYQIFINFNLLNNQILFLILCTWAGKIELFLYLLAPYYLARAMINLIFFCYRAKERLS